MTDTNSEVVNSEERRGDWFCRVEDGGCGMQHGYIYRATLPNLNGVTAVSRFTRLRVCLGGVTVNFSGDGDYTCPNCGRVISWNASADMLSRLLQAHGR